MALWPVWGAAQGYPALFDVTGVASDDVLNIRSAPSATAEIIGTLAHNETGVEVVGEGPAG
ncbi:MAG: SH3 domain-containing protein, partial [Pseudomonadota bacterium]